jgi:NAD(P)-dependent dehydrogenase (short-subunit alcohol dehydrogenase family)
VGRLQGQRALVTGASSGVGAATAQLLAREGAGVALLARGRKGLDAVAARVEQEGARAVAVPADVADREALERAVEESVRELGGLDVVVVGAAAGTFGRFQDIPVRDFDRCVAVTFGGAVDTIRAVLPHLERTGGRLVVIGSAVDTIALSLLSPYVAAKSALDGFVGSLRAELRASRSAVGVSLVRPGPIDTPFWRHLSHPPGVTPPDLPPLAAYTPESVASAVVACAIEPRASVTIGGATLLLQAASAVARPLSERALSLAARLGRALAGPDDTVDALWEPSGDGSVDGGQGGRPSVVASVRLRRLRL